MWCLQLDSLVVNRVYLRDLHFSQKVGFSLNMFTNRAPVIWLRLIIFYSKLVFVHGCSSNFKPANENSTIEYLFVICLVLKSFKIIQPSKEKSVLRQTFECRLLSLLNLRTNKLIGCHGIRNIYAPLV